MAMPHAGFCFLATTKSGSTAVERALQRHAHLAALRPPRVKHASARTFDHVFRPVLEHYGHPRESYELVCIVREPVAWAHSWWRYRQRPAARGSRAWTGDQSFAEFAERIAAGEVSLGSATEFVSVEPGRPPVERVYRYEHLDDAVAWMAGRLGVEVPDLRRVNTSPAVETPVPAATRRLLQDHYADDVALHAGAR